MQNACIQKSGDKDGKEHDLGTEEQPHSRLTICDAGLSFFDMGLDVIFRIVNTRKMTDVGLLGHLSLLDTRSRGQTPKISEQNVGLTSAMISWIARPVKHPASRYVRRRARDL